MFRALALVSSLFVSTSAVAVEKPRVIVLPVTVSGAKLEAVATSIGEQLLTELGETRRIDAVGTSDLAAMLGLERQKQLLGCSAQSSSCLAEMSSALGAPWVVMGHVSRAGKVTRVDLKLLRASDGKAVWRLGKNFKDESEMFEVVAGMVKGLVLELNPPTLEQLAEVKKAVPPAAVAVVAPTAVAVPPAVVETVPPSRPSPRIAPWVVAGAGLVALGVGTTVAAATYSDQRKYQSWVWSAPTSTADVTAQEKSANEKIVGGVVVASVGAAALAGGLLWWALGRTEPAPVTVGFMPGSNTLVVRGQF